MADFPNATNTGVTAGVTLTPYNGNLVINTPGAVIEGLDIHGLVTINASNVTLINCKITSTAFAIVRIGSGTSGVTVENCEINGVGTNNDGDIGIYNLGHGATFLNNNIYNVENGIVPASGDLIQDNYIHDLHASGAPHYDGIQIDGGQSNVTIRHNTVINDNGQTSAVMIDNYFGPISNIVVDDNVLAGGGYTIYVDGQFNKNSITGVAITNNHMGKGAWGFTDFNGTDPTYTGNINDGWNQISSSTQDPSPNPPAIDTTAPGAPTIASFSKDSGKVGDHITNDNTLTLTGTAEANSKVTVSDGTKMLGTATANGSGAWHYTTAALSNGAHNLTATATDAAGNISAASSALNVTVDTVAPAMPVIATDVVNTNDTVSLTGTAEANSTVTVFDGTTMLGTATANGSGAWSYTTAVLGNGAHDLTATATDAAGNTSATSQVVDPVIDSAGPAVPVIAAFSTDSGVIGDHITNDNTLTLTGTAEANSTVTVFDGTKMLGTATANGSGAWHYTTAALSNGAHNLTATDTDAALNPSAASSALSVTVDTNAPTAPVIATDAVNTNNTVSLTGTAEANSTVTVFDGTKVLGTTTANGGGAWSCATPALSNGAHDLTATSTDAAGNTSAASTDQSLTIASSVTPHSTGHHHHSGWSSHSFTWDSTAPTDSAFAAPSVVNTDVSPQVASAQTPSAVNDTLPSAVNDTLPPDNNVYSDLATAMAQATQNDPSVVTAADPHQSGSFHNAMISHLTKSDFHWG